jgi:outer membrane protein assembly factor BamD (BamD/ComL family)
VKYPQFILGAAVALVSLSSPLVVAAHKPADPRLFASPQAVHDLYYGDVLFYFFQNDYFQALTRLSAAQAQGRMPHHEAEAELLKGGLLLSLGQHEEAGKIFKALLNENVTDSVRNRAWFYLAKLWYQRNYLNDSEFALNSIKGTLPAGYEGERQLLHAQVLMYLDRYDEAIQLLSRLDTKDAWSAYAHFNLGVALVRQNRLDDAARMLDSVGRLNSSSEELLALQDKANLALGFAYLKANRPVEAKAVLERVRLEGSQSNKALLAAGWAEAAQQHFETALVPWTELHGRNLLDAAVQESYLAVPYAYAQLAANQQAADQYSSAINAFHEESMRIDQSIAAISAGKLVDTILEHDREAQPADKRSPDEAGWYWQLKNLPDAPETRYLYHLLATHEFQEGLKNYRDLGVMNRTLQGWSDSVIAFDRHAPSCI